MKKKLLHFGLKGLARLPLGALYLFSDMVFPLIFYMIKYRRKVVRKNLADSFPEKSEKEIKAIEKGYYRFLCDVIVETLKLFNISDAQLKRRVEVVNAEEVNKTIETGRPAVILMGHYGNWEWVQEITRYFVPSAFMASIYHPLSNKTWDALFLEMRSRWGAHIVPMNQAPRMLLDPANIPWICGFIADHHTWSRKDNNFMQFLNHETFFIFGPEELGKKKNADFFYLEMKRPKRGYYKIIFHKLLPDAEGGSFPYTRSFWKKFEQTIRFEPQLWMWSHKRWKEQ